MVNKIVFSLVILFSLFSCKDSQMLTQRESLKSKKLMLDGYYYGEKEINKQFYYPVLFIYDNGIILNSGCLFTQKSTTSQIDSCLKAIKMESYLKFKDNWGIIKINNNDIFAENWYSKDFQTGRGIRIKRGKIIDSKTFIFDEVKNSDGDFEKINEKYHFVKFNPKPDSTNKWIK